MLGKSPKVLDMSTAALTEARSHIASMIDQFGASQPLKSVMPRLARRIGVTERRVWAFWHREARHVSSAEMDALRAQVRAAAPHTIEALTHAARMDAAAAALEAIDPDFHRAEIDRLRDIGCELRRAAAVTGFPLKS